MTTHLGTYYRVKVPLVCDILHKVVRPDTTEEWITVSFFAPCQGTERDMRWLSDHQLLPDANLRVHIPIAEWESCPMARLPFCEIHWCWRTHPQALQLYGEQLQDQERRSVDHLITRYLENETPRHDPYQLCQLRDTRLVP